MEKEFIFRNDATTLYATVLEIMSFIEEVTSGADSQTTSRCSIILTELLTNGIKHTGGSASYITVKKHEDSLHLTTSDQGNLFLAENEDRHQVGKSILLSADALSELYVVVEDHNKFRFMALDQAIGDEIPVHGLLEHYGLQMITKASDHFYYEYYPEEQLNIFRSVILL